MGINKGKHIIQEIEGTRCTVVDSGISEERMNFLKKLLSHNKFDVKIANEKKAEGAADTYVIGVTDILFNPVIAIYERTLHTLNGTHVSPDFWNQKSNDSNSYYWSKK